LTEITCDIFVCVVGVWQRDFLDLWRVCLVQLVKLNGGYMLRSFLTMMVLDLLESCLQTCMTYTSAECTVNKLLMMGKGTARNM